MKIGEHIVKIHFEDEQKAKDFVSWMCGSGEQQYFQAGDYGNISVVNSFEYHIPQDEQYAKNDKKRYENSKFGGEDGLTIIAVD